SFTVYVPGSTRGPCAASNSADAAGATAGGLTRIPQPARFSPRCLLPATVSTNLPPFLVVGDLRVRRPVAPMEGLVAFRPASERIKILDRRPAWEQRRFFGHDLRRERAQRRDIVHDPDATAVRCQHQVR